MTGFGRDHYRSGARSSGDGRMHVIYVRKDGNDAHEGVAQNRAVRTMKRAFELAPSKSDRGILIDVGDGSWSEDITVPSIQFYGDSRYSRNISTRIGLSGKNSSHLGLVIRGSAGPLKNFSGFQVPHKAKRFSPEIVEGEDFDANSNKVFHPSTKFRGSIFVTPGSTVELVSICFSGSSYGVFSSGAHISAKACVFDKSLSVGINCEPHSDCWLEGCIFRCPTGIKLKNFSSLRYERCGGEIISSEKLAAVYKGD